MVQIFWATLVPDVILLSEACHHVGMIVLCYLC